MIKYPETEQYRNAVRNVTWKAQWRGKDANGDDVMDRLAKMPTLKYEGTVKIHGCFDKNTLVTLANGEEIPICELKTGDVVLSYDFASNRLVEKEITHTENGVSEKKWVELTFDDGRSIKCTDDHLFYTKNRGWVKAGELTEKDEFLENS